MENKEITAKNEEITANNGGETEENAENSVLDVQKVEDAIKSIVKSLSELGCTVAETIQAVKSVEYSLEVLYPAVYGLMEGAEALLADDSADKRAESIKKAPE